jgi:hypothetical protein
MLDPSVLWQDGASGLPIPPPLPAPPGLPAPPDTWDESPQQRNARVQQLAELVKSGAYAVHSHRLAQALLEWDPRRGNTKQSVEVADRRRAYMREYMRRRRAQLPTDLGPPPEAGQSPPPDSGLSPHLSPTLWTG